MIAHFKATTVFILVTFFAAQVNATSLYSPSSLNAHAYSSSVALGSRPEYAVDADFYEPAPTCFSTNDQLPDTQGFHWLLIDFGSIIRNIREIRLVADLKVQDNDVLTEIDAFFITELEYSKRELSQTDSRHMKQSLPWSTFHYCSPTDSSEVHGHTATVRCTKPQYGRWLAIRRKKTLQLCLVSIYVEHAFDDCFRVLSDQSIVDYRGSVFRYVRHVSEQECRSACMKAPNCDAMLFTQQRFTGTCQLVQSFRINKENQSTNLEDIIACYSDKCLIIVNDCHEGTLKELKRITPSPEANHSSQWVQDWKIQSVDIIGNQRKTQAKTTYLLSVYFDGRLECPKWNCGLLYVYSVDAEGSETLCTFINTEHLTVLENTRLRCDYKTSSPINTTIIRLKWKAVDHDVDSENIDIKLVRGHVRISSSEPEPRVHDHTTNTTSKTEKSIQMVDGAFEKHGLKIQDNTSTDFHAEEEESLDEKQPIFDSGEDKAFTQKHITDELMRSPFSKPPASTATTNKPDIREQSQNNVNIRSSQFDYDHKHNENQLDQPQTEKRQTTFIGEKHKQLKLLHYRGASRQLDSLLPATREAENKTSHSRKSVSTLVLLVNIAVIQYLFVQNIYCSV